jgi:hypothetical protein
LRDAITLANGSGGTITEIDFHIGAKGGGAVTINLASALPALTASGVFINGLSQNLSGHTTRLLTLNGSGIALKVDGLDLAGSNNIISGLIIENFLFNGIEVASSNNTIGGTSAGAGDVVSGNSGDGVLIDSAASGNLVGGNILGLDASGTTALANGGNGLEIQGTNNTVGGAVLAARNYISGNSKDGVRTTLSAPTRPARRASPTESASRSPASAPPSAALFRGRATSSRAARATASNSTAPVAAPCSWATPSASMPWMQRWAMAAMA